MRLLIIILIKNFWQKFGEVTNSVTILTLCSFLFFTTALKPSINWEDSLNKANECSRINYTFSFYILSPLDHSLARRLLLFLLGKIVLKNKQFLKIKIIKVSNPLLNICSNTYTCTYLFYEYILKKIKY